VIDVPAGIMQKGVMYEFSILTKQVVASMVEIGCNVDKKKLLNPTFASIWPLYVSVASYELATPRKSSSSPPFISGAN
jgi:hypothetical protein